MTKKDDKLILNIPSTISSPLATLASARKTQLPLPVLCRKSHFQIPGSNRSPPKFTSGHPQNADSPPVRGTRAAAPLPAPRPISRIPFQSQLGGAWPERGRSPFPLCLHKPAGGQRGILGRREGGSPKLPPTFPSPDCSGEIPFGWLFFFAFPCYFGFSLLFWLFLAFLAFPCFYFFAFLCFFLTFPCYFSLLFWLFLAFFACFIFAFACCFGFFLLFILFLAFSFPFFACFIFAFPCFFGLLYFCLCCFFSFSFLFFLFFCFSVFFFLLLFLPFFFPFPYFFFLFLLFFFPFSFLFFYLLFFAFLAFLACFIFAFAAFFSFPSFSSVFDFCFLLFLAFFFPIFLLFFLLALFAFPCFFGLLYFCFCCFFSFSCLYLFFFFCFSLPFFLFFPFFSLLVFFFCRGVQAAKLGLCAETHPFWARRLLSPPKQRGFFWGGVDIAAKGKRCLGK